MGFLKNVFHEMRLVNWPTGKELFRYTVIVLFTVVITAIFLGVVDHLTSLAFNWYVNL